MMEITAVIPTRNRHEELSRLLGCLSSQTCPPAEILIVDASDAPRTGEELMTRHPVLNIRILRSMPSVCRQRNLGIAEAATSHVFLCDDDMEPPPVYLQSIVEYCGRHPAVGAVSGVVVERTNTGVEGELFRRMSLPGLLHSFLFCLTVWADVEACRANPVLVPLLRLLQWHYRRKGNTLTSAGWPLVTQVRGGVFRTSIYGLGASVIRREWLLHSPYDESLDMHGIGDNYGVALGFPEGIHVLTGNPVFHHRSSVNRSPDDETFFRRVMALQYFLAKRGRSHSRHAVPLLWSLVGSAIAFLLRGNLPMMKASVKAMRTIISRRNPYLVRNSNTGTPAL